MESHNNDDVFNDFEHKISNRKESIKNPVKEMSEEERLKFEHEEEKHALREKHKKEAKALEEKKSKEMLKHGEKPDKNIPSIEKIVYISIILIFVIYTIIDLSYIHGKSIENQQEITAVVTGVIEEENKTDEVKETVEEELVVEKTKEKEVEEVKEEPKVEEKKLSGVITFTIDEVYMAVDENDDDLGEISKVVFTIDNGKDKVLTPIVELFVYDSESKEDYETRRRGKYTYGAGINPGQKHIGSIDLKPKKFRNLDLEKNIRLVLNDTKDGFIDAVNKVEIIS